jgi:hypothetical protein
MLCLGLGTLMHQPPNYQSMNSSTLQAPAMPPPHGTIENRKAHLFYNKEKRGKIQESGNYSIAGQA